MSAELAALQRWFQTRTMTGATKDARREILPSKTLTPDQRLAIYAEGYFLRLRDALTDDFMAVKAILGDRGFDELVRAYLAKHPSKHPSLNFLGARLPDFLDGPVRVKRRALVRDVARLEVAMQQVFDAPRAEPLDPKALARVRPEDYPRMRLELVPAFRLLALDHGVNPLVTAVRGDEPLPAAPRRKSWVAVYRKDYRVWRMDLTGPMFRVLSAFERGEDLEHAIGASGVLDPSVVFGWFADWRNEGFFKGILLPRTAGSQQRRASRRRV